MRVIKGIPDDPASRRNLVLYGTVGFLGVFAFAIRSPALVFLDQHSTTTVSTPRIYTMGDPHSSFNRPPDPGSRPDLFASPTEVAPREGLHDLGSIGGIPDLNLGGSQGSTYTSSGSGSANPTLEDAPTRPHPTRRG